VAPALTTPSATLRRLSERFGNPLLEEQVVFFIDGGVEVKVHGPSDIPWGAPFYAETHNESAVRTRIAKLVAGWKIMPDKKRVRRLPVPFLASKSLIRSLVSRTRFALF
jgi:hypothetical protein